MLPKIEAKTFKDSLFSMEGISKTTIDNHLKLYEGYVKKHNELVDYFPTIDLTTANQTFSNLRSAKLDFTFALGGVKNHEIYFSHLGGKGGEPEGILKEAINKYFGSFSGWVADLKATGMAARGWVWLAYDWRWNTWFNYLGDAHNTFPVWEGSVALALDTYEHAYWADFGTNRMAYIDAFLKNIDWEVIEKNVEGWGLK